MNDVDGFVSSVPTANKSAHIDYMNAITPVFREHGTLRVVESRGHDVPGGKFTSFPIAVKRTEDETVVCSWIEWPSSEARESGFQKVMADRRFKSAISHMPLDGTRAIHPTFDIIVDA